MRAPPDVRGVLLIDGVFIAEDAKDEYNTREPADDWDNYGEPWSAAFSTGHGGTSAWDPAVVVGPHHVIQHSAGLNSVGFSRGW